MSLKERFIYKSAIGFSAGVLVAILMYLFGVFVLDGRAAHEMVTIDLAKFILEFSLSALSGGIMGIVGNGGSVVYEIESWSILRCTTTHFSFTFAAFFVIGILNGWFTPGFSLFNVLMVGFWLLAYVMMWLIQFLVYKREVRKLNKGVELLKKAQKGHS